VTKRGDGGFETRTFFFGVVPMRGQRDFGKKGTRGFKIGKTAAGQLGLKPVVKRILGKKGKNVKNSRGVCKKKKKNRPTFLGKWDRGGEPKGSGNPHREILLVLGKNRTWRREKKVISDTGGENEGGKTRSEKSKDQTTYNSRKTGGWKA